MDALALQAIVESDEEVPLFTQVSPQQSSSTSRSSDSPLYPRLPVLETIAEFKTTPAVHAGYAVTWYGLSAAGIFMTRKLITRGRA